MNGLAQVSSPIFIEPAYGRRYLTREALLRDWEDGRDFKVVYGPYCSNRDLEYLKSTEPSGIYLITENFTVKVD